MNIAKHLAKAIGLCWKCATKQKEKLKGKYYFCDIFVLNKTSNSFEESLLVIRKNKTKAGEEIKYSVTNANLAQYTEKAIAYMQTQRFFVEHCIIESKQVLRLDQFQTCKWNAWQHQVALNIMVSCFILKEKLICFDDLPLLSVADIKEWGCFKIAQTRTDEKMIELMFFRHKRRQREINQYYINELSTVSKLN